MFLHCSPFLLCLPLALCLPGPVVIVAGSSLPASLCLLLDSRENGLVALHPYCSHLVSMGIWAEIITFFLMKCAEVWSLLL